MHVDHYKDWYQPNLEKRNYRGLYVKRTGDHSDGCAVFYNTTYVKLIEHEAVHYQQQKGTLNRDNVGLIGRFQLVNGSPLPADQRDFIVANTHILFNPRAGEVKLAQICFLLAKMNKMATNGDQTLPCILCGDFNCLPSSPFMRFLLNGHLNYSELSATAVAGYRSRRAAKHRQIPIPLLPQDMGISLDCKYQTADVDELITDESSDPLLVKDKSTKDSSLIGEDFSLSDDTSLANDDQHDDSPDSKRIKLSSEPPPAAIANESQDAVLSHSFNFISCYPLPRHGTSLVTTYHNSAAEMVDYILCTVASGGTGPTGFHPIGRRVLPSFHTLMKLGPQPNQVLSSDHLYLLVELQLVNK
jgi:protein angel